METAEETPIIFVVLIREANTWSPQISEKPHLVAHAHAHTPVHKHAHTHDDGDVVVINAMQLLRAFWESLATNQLEPQLFPPSGGAN